MANEPTILSCKELAVGYDNKPVMSRLSFDLDPGKILAIVGPSGCGKSTLMRVLGGLDQPLEGECFLLERNLVTATEQEKETILKQTGFLFQGSALFSSLTLRENVEMPMREFLSVPPEQIRILAEYKLALVGLADAMDKLPSEISGGMAKRAGLARAIALDPEIIFLDEPSAGLDPITSARLDELILKLRESFGTTIVLVSHEVPSILRTADFCVYLDPDTGTMSAYGPPQTLFQDQSNRKVYHFFHPSLS